MTGGAGVNPDEDFRPPWPLALAVVMACSHAPAGAPSVAPTAVATGAEAVAPSAAAVPASATIEPTSARGASPPMTLEQVIDQVEALIGEEERWRSMLAPALPCTWPPHDACAWFLIYEFSPLPTGTVQYRYRGPRASVRCSLEPLGCVRAVAPGGEQDGFVETEWSRGALPERSAQQFLLELLLTGRLPERAPSELGPYARWLGGQSGLGASARRRAPEFYAWLTEAFASTSE